jgi:hypothetical protein
MACIHFSKTINKIFGLGTRALFGITLQLTFKAAAKLKRLQVVQRNYLTVKTTFSQ